MEKQLNVANKSTEERILANALQHFCNFGYNGASVREITSASAVTKPTLYYYFKNKEELFSKLASTCFERVLKNFRESINRHENLDKAVGALFDCMNEMYASNPEVLKFIHGVIVSPQRGSPEVGAKEFVSQLEKQIEEILGGAVQRGQCLEDKKLSLRLLISALLSFQSKGLLSCEHSSPVDPEVFKKAVAQLLYCSQNPSCCPQN